MVLRSGEPRISPEVFEHALQCGDKNPFSSAPNALPCFRHVSATILPPSTFCPAFRPKFQYSCHLAFTEDPFSSAQKVHHVSAMFLPQFCLSPISRVKLFFHPCSATIHHRHHFHVSLLCTSTTVLKADPPCRHSGIEHR